MLPLSGKGVGVCVVVEGRTELLIVTSGVELMSSIVVSMSVLVTIVVLAVAVVVLKNVFKKIKIDTRRHTVLQCIVKFTIDFC